VVEFLILYFSPFSQHLHRAISQRELHVFAGRVKVVPSPQTQNVKVTSAKKLVTGFDDSCVASGDADGDISVVVRKQVTRTNTLAV
jgi:hypothetical protein